MSIWSEFARSYDRVLDNWSPYGELVLKAVHHMEGAFDVLDLGCGTGLVLRALASPGRRLLGVDNNPDMLAHAVERVARENLRNVTLRRGDATRLESDDASFDGVVCNNVIFYVSDAMRLLREAARVLRKGGVLAISGPRPAPDLDRLRAHTIEEFRRAGLDEQLERDFEHFLDCSRRLKTSGMPNTFEPYEVVDMLGRAGFEKMLEVDPRVYLSQSWFVAARR